MARDDFERGEAAFTGATLQMLDMVFDAEFDTSGLSAAIARDLQAASDPAATFERMTDAIFSLAFITRSAIDVAVMHGSRSKPEIRGLIEEILTEQGMTDA